MNHTPGPWTSRESDELPGFFYVSSEAGDIVYLSGGLRPHDCAANARLIAAAPEMLSILQAMLVPNAEVREVYARIEAVMERIA